MHGVQAVNRLRPAVVAAILVAAGGAATILGAYYFQYMMGLPPCPLCLEQRIAYYVSIPLAAIVAIAAGRGAPHRQIWYAKVVAAGLGVIALAMLANSGLALFHAGVEWKWWPGPQECSGPLSDLTAGGDLLSQLHNVNVGRCRTAPISPR
jgi:disulfide bond formation protein DsbB